MVIFYTFIKIYDTYTYIYIYIAYIYIHHTHIHIYVHTHTQYMCMCLIITIYILLRKFYLLNFLKIHLSYLSYVLLECDCLRTVNECLHTIYCMLYSYLYNILRTLCQGQNRCRILYFYNSCWEQKVKDKDVYIKQCLFCV